ncbi:hypothetical protein Chor_011291 [Crotalus horridus]
MGGSGSTQGSRKVSFELDEHEQVRVLQGIRVSGGICPPTTESLGQKPSEAKKDLYKRYEQEQAMVQEELLRLAKREEAVSQSLNAALQQERISDQEGKQKASHLPDVLSITFYEHVAKIVEETQLRLASLAGT